MHVREARLVVAACVLQNHGVGGAVRRPAGSRDAVGGDGGNERGGGGEGNGAAGLELVRPDQVGEQQRTGSSLSARGHARARADWPAWHLTGGPDLSDRASIRINTRFSPICKNLDQCWY